MRSVRASAPIIAAAAGAALALGLIAGPSPAAPADEPASDPTDYVRPATPDRTTGVRVSGDDSARAGGGWRGQALRDERDVGNKARDLRTADFYFSKKRGKLVGIAGFQAAPTAKKTTVAMSFGRKSGGKCNQVALVGGSTRGGKGDWIRFNSDGEVTKHGAAHLTRVGKRVIIEAKAAALKSIRANCAYADVGYKQTGYDSTGYVNFEETGQYLEYFLGDKFFDKRSTPPHTGAVVGKKKKITIGIRNDGYGLDSGPVKNVVVGLKGKKVSVKPNTDSLGSIKFVHEKWSNFRIKLKKRKTRKLSWTALGDFGWATGGVVVHPLGKPLKVKRSLVGKRFWAKGELSWRPHGLWFVNKRFAYIGFPKKGEPRCKKASKKCVRYTFKPRKGKVTIGGRKGKVRNGRITWKGRAYRPMATPTKGATWKTSLMHTNATSSGTLEQLFIWTYPNGTFVTSSDTYARSSARELRDGRGKYQVKKNGHVVFHFKSGKTVHASIGILADGSNRPNPWDRGLMIGNTYYTLSG